MGTLSNQLYNDFYPWQMDYFVLRAVPLSFSIAPPCPNNHQMLAFLHFKPTILTLEGLRLNIHS